VAIGLAVLISLRLAVLVGAGFIAQGPMFFNQAASAAILVLAVPSRAARSSHSPTAATATRSSSAS
jgi:hypothetical protein